MDSPVRLYDGRLGGRLQVLTGPVVDGTAVYVYAPSMVVPSGMRLRRVHTIPPMSREDVCAALHVYATTQGWGKYEVSGLFIFKGDTDG